MKIIFVFSAFCLSVALADSFDSMSLNEKHIKAEAECREQLKLTNINDEETQGCLEECIYKKMGFVNEDGTLNIMALPAGDNKEFRENAQRVYTRCLEKGKGNSCKVFYCLANTKEF